MTPSHYLTVEEFAARFRESEATTYRRIRQRVAAPHDPWTVAAINKGTDRRPRYLIPRSEVERFERRSAT